MSNSDLITPGLTLCHRCHREPAAAIVTEPGYERNPEPLCFDCIEQMIERENAWAVNPAAADLSAVARGDLELRHASPHVRQHLTRMNTPSHVRLARRCRAVLPSGQRCVRDATIPGRYTADLVACDTHRDGARQPGLGWTPTGEPKGGLVPLLTQTA